MNARPKPFLDLADAAAICHGPYQLPGDGGPNEQRDLEAREDWKRERDEYTADGSGAIEWE